MNYDFESYCHECGDISTNLSDVKVHIGIARKHHKLTGHTCEVYMKKISTVLNGTKPEVFIHPDIHIIAVFEKHINQPG